MRALTASALLTRAQNMLGIFIMVLIVVYHYVAVDEKVE